ncbi:MAG: hypothetical protein LBG52_06105 [Candidatus Peribacteria bacterium]|jgi:hypothetical protein|nr:hypothetical protein [Candidatus Peribacteria bacterium]
MTDQSTPVSHGQAQNPVSQPPKNMIFGGEVNFSDGDHFELPTQTSEEPLTFDPPLSAENRQSQPVATEDFAAFDPFGDEKADEMPVKAAPFMPPTTDNEPISSDDESIKNEEFPVEKSNSSPEIFNEEQSIVEDIIPRIESVSIPKTGNPLFDKFFSLTDTARAIFALSEDKSNFTIVGGKTDTSLLEYFVYLIEDEINHLDLFIKKVETQNEEEHEHLLQWSYDTSKQHLDILVDEILLYQLDETAAETSGVFDKLNKF